MTVPYVLAAIAVGVPLYAYIGYPLLLALISSLRRKVNPPPAPRDWPPVTVTIPVYNEERVIRNKLERVLNYDYPRERLQVLVVSDASTDRTDEIVREFAPRGVELIRLARRGGKTAAENAALPHLRGEIVVNSDASVRADPAALKRLVAWFEDPAVGVASGRDVSVSSVEDYANVGESSYVGYEMWVRRLETRLAGIIGASGCFYAIRKHLHQHLVPEALSRDFAAPLVAREHGYRSVSVDDAVVFVPRAGSLRQEYRRKVRTMTRGLETLFFKRHLLNPFRYGLFAWELASHKLMRWLVPWALLLGVAALASLTPVKAWALWATVGVVASGIAGLAGWFWPQETSMPRWLAIPAYYAAGIAAGLHAWVNALRREMNPVWEPTRREVNP
ncbi:MAG TPA: glycosyltransferase family 2 protein [Gemmatimonadales bacterium]|nr:glycosyltransferase family 2 protein [Gemmatimonadales bacterium]